MLNGEFMKRQKKFKSSPWPVANKRKPRKRTPLQFFTPWGYISEVGSNWTFSKVSFQIVLILLLSVYIYFGWFANV